MLRTDIVRYGLTKHLIVRVFIRYLSMKIYIGVQK